MISRASLTPAALAVSACLGLVLSTPVRAQGTPSDIPRPEPTRDAGRAVWPEAPLKFDGSWEYTHERRKNFDLDKTRARDRRTDEHELKLGLGAAASPVLAWYLQAVALAEDRHTEGSGRDRSSTLDRGEMWLQWRPSAASSGFLQVGRLPWAEKRSWWWDEDLDGLRWHHAFGDVTVQTGLAKEWGRASTEWSGIDPAQRGVQRWFGQVGWSYAPRHSVEAFWLKASDRSGVQ
jgi:alginate production protein